MLAELIYAWFVSSLYAGLVLLCYMRVGERIRIEEVGARGIQCLGVDETRRCDVNANGVEQV